MEKNKEVLLTRQFYLKRILEKLEKATADGILTWDLKSLDNPFIYRSTFDGFYGPIYADYYNTSVTISGTEFSFSNSPGCSQELNNLLDSVRRTLDHDTRVLLDFERKLDKFLQGPPKSL